MATATVLAAVGHGVTTGNLVVYQVIPALGTILVALGHVCAVVEVEVVHQTVDALRVARAGRLAIVHLAGHAHPEHQLCDGLALCLIGSAVVVVEDVVPVDGRVDGDGAECHRLLALCSVVGLTIAGDGAFQLGRPAVIGHDLCHGGGHAARGTVTALGAVLAVEVRTEQVVRVALVPCRGEKGGHIVTDGGPQSPRSPPYGPRGGFYSFII